MSETHSQSEESDELVDNGLIFSNNLLAVELIQRILCYVDEKTLLHCQLVCKYWNEIIKDYVWRKKAEIKTGCKIPINTVLEAKDFFSICTHNLFERNLMKNHSGAEQFKHWQITQNRGQKWIIECPPSGAPSLPPEPIFEDKQHCFVTSFGECGKQYTVDLIDDGFTVNILDNLKPTIEVSEWYSCRYDCPAQYNMRVCLLNQFDEILDEFLFGDILEGDRQNVWLNVKHEFKGYGRGLRKIRFIHRGKDRYFWRGHYGSKMAGASVIVNVPDSFIKLS